MQQIKSCNKKRAPAVSCLAPCTTEHVTHEVIENKFLAALSEDDKVGAIFTKENLIDLLGAAESYPYNSSRQLRLRQLAKGMRQLLDAAFPKWTQ